MKQLELKNIPHELIIFPQWAVWKYETGKDGKQTKIPYQPTGLKAKSTDPGTWSSYHACVAALQRPEFGFDGLFFVLSENDPYSVVDFDHCIEDGIIRVSIAEMVDDLWSYTEISPSGEGLHVWVKSEPPGDRNRRAGTNIEFYSTARFMTVTGWFDGGPPTIEERSKELKKLYDGVFEGANDGINHTKQTPIMVDYEVGPEPGLSFTDEEIIDKALRAANGAKFKLLYYYGDISGHNNDKSTADLALCDILAFWTEDYAQIERIFGTSALARQQPKWFAREDYRRRTILKALERPQIDIKPEPEPTKEKEDQERSDVAFQQALEIHKSGDPVKFILDTFETIHIGDRAPATGVLCGFACQAITNTKGLQPSAYGESGYGKSHLAETMCWLAYQKYIMAETLSDKALYNMRDELLPGTTIFSDDVTLSPDLADVLKRATSRYQKPTPRRVSEQSGGKWVGVKQILPPRLMWLLTSVDQSGGIQVANRQLAFSVDESEEHQRKVIEFEMWKANNAIPDFPLSDDVLVCRELIRIIREKDDGSERLMAVKTPYLPDSIDWNDIKNTRNLGMFLDLIKSFAMLRFMQREVDDNGVLVANEDDLNDAINLYLIYAQDQMHHVTKSERKFLEKVMVAGEEGITTEELMNELNVTQQRVWKLGNNLAEKIPGFLIEKHSRSESDMDGLRKSKTFNVYSINKFSFALGDYESVLSRKK